MMQVFAKQALKQSNLVAATGVSTSLVHKPKKNKISYSSTKPYNKRWEFKWKHSYYTYPRDGEDHTYVKKPQDSKDTVPLFWAYCQDVLFRYLPGAQQWYDRRVRMYDPFSLYVLPSVSVGSYLLSDLTTGFKMLIYLPWLLLYVRIRDKTLDPDFKETYLRDMIYQNSEITELFNEETIHVLDYDCEFEQGFGDCAKFPEYNNQVYKFFNTDSGQTRGYFKFGDVESGATMNLKFKTMPSPGRFRYQVGEPFYFYDLRAEITHNGTFKEVVLVNEADTLKFTRPFLYLI